MKNEISFSLEFKRQVMATVLSRGEAANSATLATSDHRLIAVLREQGRHAL